MLEQQLEQLGFNSQEIRIFLALSEMGSASVQELADRCGFARSSIYGFTKRLVEQRAFVWGEVEGRRVLSLGSHDALLRSVQRKKDELNTQEEVASSIAEHLKRNASKDRPPVSKFQIFSGKSEIEAMLYEYRPKMLRSYIRLNHYTMWGYQDHSFVEEYRAWHDEAWEDRLPRQDIKLFSTREGVEQQLREKIPLREIRYLPLGSELESSVWIHGEYVLLANTRKSPHRAVLIFEPSLAVNLRGVFQLLWVLSKSS